MIKNIIYKYLLNDNLFFYFKGRVALYAILTALNIKKNDEIILPAYTCVVVPNAILYLKAKPVYIDINSDTYNIDYTKIEAKITSKTKAIIIQNTYGLSSNIEEILNIAKKYDIYTIEDCCHGFGGFYNGKPNGTYCDAAFFSTQWNKPFSTGLGGFAVINNENILNKIKELEKIKIAPTFNDRLSLKLLYFIKKLFLTDFTYWNLLKLYRFLSKHNLILGSSNGGEITSTKMPKDFFKDFSNIQTKEGVKNLESFDNLLKLRKKNAIIYTEFLKEHNKKYVHEKYFSNHSFLKYPLLVKDRNNFFKIAEKCKITLGDWFVSPLHPVKTNLEKWGFEANNYPIAVGISKRIVNLPTDIKDIDKVLKFLLTNIEAII
jgi:perosamine synthetase